MGAARGCIMRCSESAGSRSCPAVHAYYTRTTAEGARLRDEHHAVQKRRRTTISSWAVVDKNAHNPVHGGDLVAVRPQRYANALDVPRCFLFGEQRGRRGDEHEARIERNQVRECE